MNTECTCVSKVERELAQLSFAMDDLRLFLDTHRFCRNRFFARYFWNNFACRFRLT